MKYVYLVLSWGFGLLFLLAGIASLMENPFGGICLIAISALLLPPIRKFIHSKTNKEFSIKYRAISIFVLFLLSGMFASQTQERKAQEKAIQETKQNSEKIAQIRQENIDYYNSNREQIISSTKTALSIKDYKAVISQSRKYLISGDKELEKIYLQAQHELDTIQKTEKTNQLLAELKNINTKEHDKNKSIFQQLYTLHPENKQYKEKLDFYTAKIAEEEEKSILEVERKKKIDSQFSAWDGSHRGLERIIKKTMNDPDSYKHVETVYWDKGNHLVVKTTFRGKNAFGGVVVNWVKAKSDMDGNIIEIIESYP